MFLIIGISQAQKKLAFDQLTICPCCGKYGHIEVFVTYSYLMLFFIPVFKWNKTYQIKMSCCNAVADLDPDLGKALEKGKIVKLGEEAIRFGCSDGKRRKCGSCGFSTEEDYQFCPRCGRPF